MNCNDTMIKRKIDDRTNDNIHKKQKMEGGFVYSVVVVCTCGDYERLISHVSDVFPTKETMLKDMKFFYNTTFVKNEDYDGHYELCTDYRKSQSMLNNVRECLLDEGGYVMEFTIKRVKSVQEEELKNEIDYILKRLSKQDKLDLDGIRKDLIGIQHDLGGAKANMDLGEKLSDVANFCVEIRDLLGVYCPVKVPELDLFLISPGDEDDYDLGEYNESLSSVEGAEYEKKMKEIHDIVTKVIAWFNSILNF